MEQGGDRSLGPRSRRVAEVARPLDDAMNDLLVLARQRQLLPREWQIDRDPAQRRLEAFVDAVRRDLSLPPLQVRRHWLPPTPAASEIRELQPQVS